jgi:hypothetical protein
MLQQPDECSEQQLGGQQTISDKFRDLTGQKSAQEKAQDKAGDAVDHLKETGQSAKKGIEHAADATKEKFQGN